MRATLGWILKHLGLFAGYGVVCVLLTLAAVYATYLRALADLKPWHTAQLTAEFTAVDASRVRTAADYRALEDRLFASLAHELYDVVPAEERRAINRYSPGSLADARKVSVDWNWTFDLSGPAPRGAELLLHGMSDSAYSLRALGAHLHARGYRAVGLHLPGHGAAPSGLLEVKWQDMTAAVIGAEWASDQSPDRAVERTAGTPDPMPSLLQNAWSSPMANATMRSAAAIPFGGQSNQSERRTGPEVWPGFVPSDHNRRFIRKGTTPRSACLSTHPTPGDSRVRFDRRRRQGS